MLPGAETPTRSLHPSLTSLNVTVEPLTAQRYVPRTVEPQKTEIAPGVSLITTVDDVQAARSGTNPCPFAASDSPFVLIRNVHVPYGAAEPAFARSWLVTLRA